VLLNASTEELQEFARLYAHDEEAFGAVTTLVRAEAPDPGSDR
jgi:hypothetical protein